ncbi:MAG: acyl carrier protein [Planctomycetia bacterium]|nr:acyl carrier protein [Planctomycetia bacterium]
MSRTDAEIRDVVIGELRRIAPDVDSASLKPTDHLREALEIDSYDFLQLLIGLNKKLGIDVPESDYGKLRTIDDIVGYSQNRNR